MVDTDLNLQVFSITVFMFLCFVNPRMFLQQMVILWETNNKDGNKDEKYTLAYLTVSSTEKEQQP